MAPSTASLTPRIALGVTLARRGPLAVVSMAVSVLTALVLAVFAVGLARRGGDAPVGSVPLLASSAIVWGGGFLQAVAVSAGALRRDRTEGIRHLIVTRTTSLRGYLVARVGGLAAVLAAFAGGGTLFVGVVAILAAGQGHTVTRTLHSTFASLVYVVAFALVIAPVAFAALGARTRVSGYFFLLLILVVPEIVARTLNSTLPTEVTELCAIPSALAALRSSIAPGSVEPLRTLRALVALALFAGVAMFFVRRDLMVLEREGG
ncbi:MAG: hypothetical protein K0S65_500 [Labilithrix sp.]|jgi:hypothetical protein|nr:hypothetical protein [Labilithrix sp.]